jgi:serine/alanine adding enzyme
LVTIVDGLYPSRAAVEIGGAEAHRGAPHVPEPRPQVPVRVTADGTETEWDAYVYGHPDATADHLWRWRQVFTEVFGHACQYLVARRAGVIAGVLPLVLFRSRIFGRLVVSLPFLNYGGVLADDDAAAEALIERAETVARDFRASHVELRHRARRFQSLAWRQHKLGSTRQLPSTSDELWKESDRKVRNQVRKAQKEGLVAVKGGAELVREFYAVFARNMRDLGTPVYSQRLFDTTLSAFAGRAQVHLVRRGTETLAGGISIRFRDTVLVPWASSLREFRHLCPNMLLYWAMLEGAVADGARVFDFGRSSPDAGTHAFKLQWGATATPLHWEYVLLSGQRAPDHGPANPRFHAAIEAWKRLPLSFASRVGPLVARHLP